MVLLPLELLKNEDESDLLARQYQCTFEMELSKLQGLLQGMPQIIY